MLLNMRDIIIIEYIKVPHNASLIRNFQILKSAWKTVDVRTAEPFNTACHIMHASVFYFLRYEIIIQSRNFK
jgi:hypothetical protein